MTEGSAVQKLSREFTIRCRMGARVSALFCAIVSRFSSNVTVHYRGARADPRKMMELMLLGNANVDSAPPYPEGSGEEVDVARRRWIESIEPQSGHTLTVEVEGPDAEAAMKEIFKLFSRNFDMPEEPPKP